MRCQPLDATFQQHYGNLITFLLDGRVVPFLGAGANLCGRPPNLTWPDRNRQFLPSGSELSAYLANEFKCPPDPDLARVSQYVSLTTGSGGLFGSLHDVFDHDYPPTTLHRLLAEFPAMLRAKGHPSRYQLIVSTNYDDVLERAFRDANEPFDLVTYISEGDTRGKFLHSDPDGNVRVIDIPNQYRELSLEKRTILLKIHGAINRAVADGEADSYVITEDHYIDYLTRTDLANLIPVTLTAKLRKSHFLFLGYGLRDWNLRVILHRIAGEQRLNYQSWAIQRHPTTLDEKFWGRRDVDILDIDLARYIAAVRGRLRLLPQADTAPMAGAAPHA
jgi:SIR2-like protein